MSRRVGGVEVGSLAFRKSSASDRGAESTALIKELLDERLAIERLSDDTVALRKADGTLVVLSADETAALAALILRAVQEGAGDFRALMRLHDLTAARNLGEDAALTTGNLDGAPPSDPAGAQPENSAKPPEGWVPPAALPGGTVMSDGPSSAGAAANPDNAQFGTAFTPGFVGPARGALPPLPDEALRFRDSFRRGLTMLDIGDQPTPLAQDIGDRRASGRADANAFDTPLSPTLYDAGFIGPAINHLPPLLNEDYRFAEPPPRPLGDPRLDESMRRPPTSQVRSPSPTPMSTAPARRAPTPRPSR
jgi:hypothetical protein